MVAVGASSLAHAAEGTSGSGSGRGAGHRGHPHRAVALLASLGRAAPRVSDPVRGPAPVPYAPGPAAGPMPVESPVVTPRLRRLLASTVAVATIVAAPVVAEARGGGGSEVAALAQAKEKIAAIKRQLDDAAATASAAEAELAGADARLAEVEDAVNEAAAALERQEAAVDEAARRLDALEADADRLRDAFDRRAADIYKRGSGLPFEIVLTSGDMQDALERSSFLRVITASDTATLEGITNGQVAVGAQRELLEAERSHLQVMYQQQEELLAQVAELRRSKALAAAAARAEVDQLEHEKEELEADSKKLERIIKARASSGGRVSSPSTSGYSWPLCGAVTSEYGRRWGRMHEGLDIDDNRSSAILAAKDGVVIFAGWQGGYGRLTLIDHGGVVTAYAHQAAFGVSRGAGREPRSAHRDRRQLGQLDRLPPPLRDPREQPRRQPPALPARRWVLSVLATISFPVLERIPLFADAAFSPHGLGIAIGFLVGARLFVTRAGKRGLGHAYVEDIPGTLNALLVRIAVGAMIGARLFYVLTHLDTFLREPLRILAVWEGGLTFLGGVAGAVIAVVPVLHRRGYRPAQVLDSAAPGLALGLLIGRLGDLVIGDHIGTPTDFVLGWRCTGNYWQSATNSIGYTAPRPYPIGAATAPTAGCFDVAVHQTAMYDFLATGIVLLLLLAYERRERWDGFFAVTWVYAYGALRFLSDFARQDRRLLGLTGSQYAVLATVVAVSVWVVTRRPWHRTPWAWDLRFAHAWLTPPDGDVDGAPAGDGDADADGDPSG